MNILPIIFFLLNLDSESKKVLLEYNEALKEKLKILERENLLNNSNKFSKGMKIDSDKVKNTKIFIFYFFVRAIFKKNIFLNHFFIIFYDSNCNCN